jgi:hypothetical protein
MLKQIIDDAQDADYSVITDVIPKPDKIKKNTVDNKEPQKCQKSRKEEETC